MATATKKEDIDVGFLFEKDELSFEEILEFRRKLCSVGKAFSKFASVLKELEPAKSKKLSETKAGTRKGIGFWITNNLPEAITTLENAHSSKDRDYFLALAYNDAGQYGKAGELINKLYRDMPDELPVMLAYVDIKIKSGDVEDALAVLQKAKKDVRNKADIHYYFGLYYEHMGKYQESDKEYQNALRIENDHAPTLFRMAYNADLNGSEETAMELYQRIRRPTRNVLINMGILYEDKGNFAMARTCYHKVLNVIPNDERARLYAGDVEAAGDMFYDEELRRKELALRQLLNQPISDFRLSLRNRKLMEQMDIRTLGDLVKMTEDELLKSKNFGQKSLSEVKDLLARRGLSMRHPEQPFSIELLAREQTLVAPQKTESLLNKSVFEIDWSARVRSAMDKLKIYTLGDLVNKTEYDFLGIRNFGATSLDEIRARLKQMGLSLATPE